MGNRVRITQTDQGRVYVILGIKEPLGLPPPRSSRNCYSPLKKQWADKIKKNKYASPQFPSLVESYPPITLVLVHLESNNVFIIHNDQNITFPRHTGLLIIF
jgi:hypothetical protein